MAPPRPSVDWEAVERDRAEERYRVQVVLVSLERETHRFDTELAEGRIADAIATSKCLRSIKSSLYRLIAGSHVPDPPLSQPEQE